MNQKGFSSIAIILIVVGVLVTGGGIYWQQTKKIETPPTSIVPTPTSISKPETSNQNNAKGWIYSKNYKYGYEVGYPEGWIEDCPRVYTIDGWEPKVCSEFGFSHSLLFRPDIPDFDYYLRKDPYFKISPSDNSLKYIDDNKNNYWQKIIGGLENCKGYDKIDTVTSGSGEKGYLIAWRFAQRDGFEYLRYIAYFDYPYPEKIQKLIDELGLDVAGNVPKAFEIDFGSNTKLELIHQILSTFKFTK